MEQDEIITNLSELKKNWFLGMETDSRFKTTIKFLNILRIRFSMQYFKIFFTNFRWKESIVREVPNLFSLQVNTTIILIIFIIKEHKQILHNVKQT